MADFVTKENQKYETDSTEEGFNQNEKADSMKEDTNKLPTFETKKKPKM